MFRSGPFRFTFFRFNLFRPLQEVVVEYSSEKEFQALAKQLGVMQDFKAGVPRTAYMGVVSLWVGNTKVYLAPRSFKAR